MEIVSIPILNIDLQLGVCPKGMWSSDTTTVRPEKNEPFAQWEINSLRHYFNLLVMKVVLSRDGRSFNSHTNPIGLVEHLVGTKTKTHGGIK